jgi:hypothetical protein
MRERLRCAICGHRGATLQDLPGKPVPSCKA